MEPTPTTPAPAVAPTRGGPIKVGTVALIAAGVIALAKQSGIITATGEFVNVSADEWTRFSAHVVGLLTEQGVDLPPNLTKAVEFAPFVVAFLVRR